MYDSFNSTTIIFVLRSILPKQRMHAVYQYDIIH